MTVRGGRGVTYAARLRVLATGGSVAANINQIAVTGASEVVLLVTAATDFSRFWRPAIDHPLAATKNRS